MRQDGRKWNRGQNKRARGGGEKFKAWEKVHRAASRFKGTEQFPDISDVVFLLEEKDKKRWPLSSLKRLAYLIEKMADAGSLPKRT